MRILLSMLSCAIVLVSGCASHRGGSATFSEIPSVARSASQSSAEKVTMTPDTLLVGKVSKVNLEGRFVVLTFPIGHLPALQQRLSVYRRGLKVGEVRITGPQLDDDVVGDIAAGDAQTGDQVRSQ